DDILRLVGVQNRHPVDRARLVRTGHGVHDVVRANDEGYIGGLELRVDLIEIRDDVVRYTRFRQQHVHVTRHAPGHRVNRELHRDATIDEQLAQLPNLVLRLGYRHAVAGHHNHFLRKGHHDTDIGGLDRFHAAG